MVAQKFSFLFILLMGSCASSVATHNVIVTNKVGGCFTFISKSIKSGEPVNLQLQVAKKDPAKECQCKSALLKYTAYQESGNDVSMLISGSFTALNKTSVVLPISAQSQLLLKEQPINVSITCAG